MEKLKVMRENEQVGTVETEREGLFTTLRCSCTYFPRVMRLYGVQGSEFVPIGILVPVGGRLRLTKKYSGNDLRILPIESITHYELVCADETPEKPTAAIEITEEEPTDTEKTEECMAEADKEETPECAPLEESEKDSPWRTVDDPGALFADPELMETASVIRGGMVAEDENSLLFAIPISSDTPFPLMPVFRYGWSAMVEGKCCIVFRLRDGKLI